MIPQYSQSNPHGAVSSVGQSRGLIILWSLVQVQHGLPSLESAQGLGSLAESACAEVWPRPMPAAGFWTRTGRIQERYFREASTALPLRAPRTRTFSWPTRVCAAASGSFEHRGARIAGSLLAQALSPPGQTMPHWHAWPVWLPHDAQERIRATRHAAIPCGFLAPAIAGAFRKCRRQRIAASKICKCV